MAEEDSGREDTGPPAPDRCIPGSGPSWSSFRPRPFFLAETEEASLRSGRQFLVGGWIAGDPRRRCAARENRLLHGFRPSIGGQLRRCLTPFGAGGAHAGAEGPGVYACPGEAERALGTAEALRSAFSDYCYAFQNSHSTGQAIRHARYLSSFFPAAIARTGAWGDVETFVLSFSGTLQARYSSPGGLNLLQRQLLVEILLILQRVLAEAVASRAPLSDAQSVLKLWPLLIYVSCSRDRAVVERASELFGVVADALGSPQAWAGGVLPQDLLGEVALKRLVDASFTNRYLSLAAASLVLGLANVSFASDPRAASFFRACVSEKVMQQLPATVETVRLAAFLRSKVFLFRARRVFERQEGGAIPGSELDSALIEYYRGLVDGRVGFSQLQPQPSERGLRLPGHRQGAPPAAGPRPAGPPPLQAASAREASAGGLQRRGHTRSMSQVVTSSGGFRPMDGAGRPARGSVAFDDFGPSAGGPNSPQCPRSSSSLDFNIAFGDASASGEHLRAASSQSQDFGSRGSLAASEPLDGEASLSALVAERSSEPSAAQDPVPADPDDDPFYRRRGVPLDVIETLNMWRAAAAGDSEGEASVGSSSAAESSESLTSSQAARELARLLGGVGDGMADHRAGSPGAQVSSEEGSLNASMAVTEEASEGHFDGDVRLTDFLEAPFGSGERGDAGGASNEGTEGSQGPEASSLGKLQGARESECGEERRTGVPSASGASAPFRTPLDSLVSPAKQASARHALGTPVASRPVPSTPAPRQGNSKMLFAKGPMAKSAGSILVARSRGTEAEAQMHPKTPMAGRESVASTAAAVAAPASTPAERSSARPAKHPHKAQTDTVPGLLRCIRSFHGRDITEMRRVGALFPCAWLRYYYGCSRDGSTSYPIGTKYRAHEKLPVGLERLRGFLEIVQQRLSGALLTTGARGPSGTKTKRRLTTFELTRQEEDAISTAIENVVSNMLASPLVSVCRQAFQESSQGLYRGSVARAAAPEPFLDDLLQVLQLCLDMGFVGELEALDFDTLLCLLWQAPLTLRTFTLLKKYVKAMKAVPSSLAHASLKGRTEKIEAFLVSLMAASPDEATLANPSEVQEIVTQLDSQLLRRGGMGLRKLVDSLLVAKRCCSFLLVELITLHDKEFVTQLEEDKVLCKLVLKTVLDPTGPGRRSGGGHKREHRGSDSCSSSGSFSDPEGGGGFPPSDAAGRGVQSRCGGSPIARGVFLIYLLCRLSPAYLQACFEEIGVPGLEAQLKSYMQNIVLTVNRDCGLGGVAEGRGLSFAAHSADDEPRAKGEDEAREAVRAEDGTGPADFSLGNTPRDTRAGPAGTVTSCATGDPLGDATSSAADAVARNAAPASFHPSGPASVRRCSLDRAFNLISGAMLQLLTRQTNYPTDGFTLYCEELIRRPTLALRFDLGLCRVADCSSSMYVSTQHVLGLVGLLATPPYSFLLAASRSTISGLRARPDLQAIVARVLAPSDGRRGAAAFLQAVPPARRKIMRELVEITGRDGEDEIYYIDNVVTKIAVCSLLFDDSEAVVHPGATLSHSVIESILLCLECELLVLEAEFSTGGARSGRGGPGSKVPVCGNGEGGSGTGPLDFLLSAEMREQVTATIVWFVQRSTHPVTPSLSLALCFLFGCAPRALATIHSEQGKVLYLAEMNPGYETFPRLQLDAVRLVVLLLLAACNWGCYPLALYLDMGHNMLRALQSQPYSLTNSLAYLQAAVTFLDGVELYGESVPGIFASLPLVAMLSGVLGSLDPNLFSRNEGLLTSLLHYLLPLDVQSYLVQQAAEAERSGMFRSGGSGCARGAGGAATAAPRGLAASQAQAEDSRVVTGLLRGRLSTLVFDDMEDLLDQICLGIFFLVSSGQAGAPGGAFGAVSAGLSSSFSARASSPAAAAAAPSVPFYDPYLEKAGAFVGADACCVYLIAWARLVRHRPRLLLDRESHARFTGMLSAVASLARQDPVGASSQLAALGIGDDLSSVDDESDLLYTSDYAGRGAGGVRSGSRPTSAVSAGHEKLAVDLFSGVSVASTDRSRAVTASPGSLTLQLQAGSLPSASQPSATLGGHPGTPSTPLRQFNHKSVTQSGSSLSFAGRPGSAFRPVQGSRAPSRQVDGELIHEIPGLRSACLASLDWHTVALLFPAFTFDGALANFVAEAANAALRDFDEALTLEGLHGRAKAVLAGEVPTATLSDGKKLGFIKQTCMDVLALFKPLMPIASHLSLILKTIRRCSRHLAIESFPIRESARRCGAQSYTDVSLLVEASARCWLGRDQRVFVPLPDRALEECYTRMRSRSNRLAIEGESGRGEVESVASVAGIAAGVEAQAGTPAGRQAGAPAAGPSPSFTSSLPSKPLPDSSDSSPQLPKALSRRANTSQEEQAHHFSFLTDSSPFGSAYEGYRSFCSRLDDSYYLRSTQVVDPAAPCGYVIGAVVSAASHLLGLRFFMDPLFQRAVLLRADSDEADAFFPLFYSLRSAYQAFCLDLQALDPNWFSLDPLWTYDLVGACAEEPMSTAPGTDRAKARTQTQTQVLPQALSQAQTQRLTQPSALTAGPEGQPGLGLASGPTQFARDQTAGPETGSEAGQEKSREMVYGASGSPWVRKSSSALSALGSSGARGGYASHGLFGGVGSNGSCGNSENGGKAQGARVEPGPQLRPDQHDVRGIGSPRGARDSSTTSSSTPAAVSALSRGAHGRYAEENVHTITLSAEKHQRLLKRAALAVCARRDAGQKGSGGEPLPSLMRVATSQKDLQRYFHEYDYAALLSDPQEFWRARLAEYASLLYQRGGHFLLPFTDRLALFRHVARIESSAYLKEQTLSPDAVDYMGYVPTRSSAIEVCVDRRDPLCSLEESLLRTATIARANSLKPWRVSFQGEAALDLHGPRQEFLTLAAAEYELRGRGISRSSHLPVREGDGSVDGRLYALLIARAITEFLVLPYKIPITLAKRILGRPYSVEDLEHMSADKYYGFYCVLLNVGREKFEDYLGISSCDVPASPELDTGQDMAGEVTGRTVEAPEARSNGTSASGGSTAGGVQRGLSASGSVSAPVPAPAFTAPSLKSPISASASNSTSTSAPAAPATPARKAPLPSLGAQRSLPAQVPIGPTPYSTALASINAIMGWRSAPIDSVARCLGEFLSAVDLSVFSPTEVQDLVSGEFVVTPEAILAALSFEHPGTDISSTEVSSATEAAFRAAVGKMSCGEAEALLRFVTGSARIPTGGFQPPLKVQRLRFDGETPKSRSRDIPRSLRLPTASTCFNMLKLPPYTDPDQLYRVLLNICGEGATFEFS